MPSTTIGRIGHHKRHPDRLALIGTDGKPRAWFAADETPETVAGKLREAGRDAA